MGRDVGCACSSAAAPVRVADRVCWRWGRRPRGDWRRARLSEDGGGTGGPVAASTRPPPTSTRRVLSWRAPLRRRRLCVADRVCWRWGRRPRGDWRRVRHSEDGGGTGGPVAASTRPPPTSTRRVLSWRTASPSAPVARRRPCLLEVGSPTPRRLAPREAFGGRRRDRGSRRGLNEATSNEHPQGSLLEGAAPSAPVARRVHQNGRAW
jgi:hypothetical protein